MAQLEDYWGKVTANQQFQALPDDQKEVARQRVFERMVGRSKAYLDAPEASKSAIRQRFDQRIALPTKNGSSGVMGKVLEAGKAGVEQVAESLGTLGKAVTQPEEVLKLANTELPDVSLEKVGGEKTLKGTVRKVSQKTQEAIAPSELSQEAAAAAATSPNAVTRVAGKGMEAVNALRTVQAGAVGTAGEFLAEAIPQTVGDVALYITLPAIEKMAGRTFLGKDLMTKSPEVTLGEDLSNMITQLMVEEKNPKPLEQLARTEETIKYEKWLQENDSASPIDDRFDNFTPAAKVNFSQLRDAAKARLEYLKSEPVRLGELAESEKGLPGQEPRGLLPERIYRKGVETKRSFIPVEGGPEAPLGLPAGPEQPAVPLLQKNVTPRIGQASPKPGYIPLGPIDVKPETLQAKPFGELLSEVNEDMGRRGGGFGDQPVDPNRELRLKANAKELIRRGKEMGLTTTEDLMKFAAAHSGEGNKSVFHEATKDTVNLSPVEEWPGKEAEAALQGNQIARASMRERAWSEFTNWQKKREKNSLIVWKKAGDENTMALKAYFFRHDALFGLTAEERSALPFLIQDKTPKADLFREINPNADRILELAANPTEKMLRAKDLIRPHEDEAFEMLSKYSDKIQYREDYVRQTWKNPEKFANWLDQRRFKNPLEKQREFETFADGINAGFEPTSLDMNEILARVDTMRIRTTSISKVRGWLEEAKTIDGQKALLPETEAPADWQRIDHPAFREDGVRLAVSPDYKPLIKYAFESKSTFLPTRMAAMFNALSKQGNLAFSFFHGQTLLLDQFAAGQPIKRLLGIKKEFPWIAPSESAPWQLVAGIGKSIGREMQPTPEGFEKLSSMGQLVDRMGRAYDAYMSGNPILQNRAVALDAAEHGVPFDSVPDLEYNMLSKTLRGIGDVVAKAYPGLKTPFELAAKGVDVQLKTIFTHIRNMGSLITYESQLADNLKAFPDMPVEQVKAQTGKFVGKMFGGVAFTALMASPKMVQFLHLLHFAPDWFYTTWMREGAAASGYGKMFTGRKMNPEERQAAFWMARLALGYAISGNSINYAMTQKYLGKGRMMWENEPGHELDIYIGTYPDPKTGKPGRAKYMVPGRGFTDPYEVYMDPIKYARGRVSPSIRAAAAAVTGYNPGGYPLAGKTPAGKFLEYGKRVAWPFSFTGQTAFFTYPLRKGMGYHGAKDLFLKSYETDNPKYRQQAIQFGNESHLGGNSLERADSEAQQEYRKGLLK